MRSTILTLLLGRPSAFLEAEDSLIGRVNSAHYFAICARILGAREAYDKWLMATDKPCDKEAWHKVGNSCSFTQPIV